jgi:hypothetical protein
MTRDEAAAEVRRAAAILAQTELAAVHAARRCGVHVSLVYSVIGPDGKIYRSHSFRDAVEAGRQWQAAPPGEAGARIP